MRSILNRAELTRIATAGGGRYYELDRETDREIANQIIDQTRRRAGTTGIQEGTQRACTGISCSPPASSSRSGVLFLRDRVALALQLGAAAAVFVFVQAYSVDLLYTHAP